LNTNTLPKDVSREDALRFISNSASYGNLCLFVGSGFSKAVLNDESQDVALSWGELLEQASKKLSIDYESIPKEGVSYPEIASRVCQKYSQRKHQ